MSTKKKTLVIGASEKLERYSNKAIRLLTEHGHPVVAIGARKGEVASISFDKEKKDFSDLNTVTIYLNAKRQGEYYDYIINLKPQRVVFNPGAENPEFEALLTAQNIEAMEACTLVLLRTGQY